MGRVFRSSTNSRTRARRAASVGAVSSRIRWASRRRIPTRISQSGRKFFSSRASSMSSDGRGLPGKPGHEGARGLLVATVDVAATAQTLLFGHGYACYAQEQVKDAGRADDRDPAPGGGEGEDEVGHPDEPLEKI